MKSFALITAIGFVAIANLSAAETNSAPASEPPPVKYGAHEFRPGALWLDNHGVPINAHGGGMLYHDGTYYWFGEHKVAGSAGNKAQVGVHVYSSTNLYSWKDEGIALAVSDDPKSEITRGCVIERPKVIFNEKTGKFVMWFHLELKGQGYHAARSGVAIADEATGPYRYLYSLRPNAGVWPENAPKDLCKPLTKAEQDSLAQLKLPGGAVKGQLFPTNLLFRRDFATGQMTRDMTLFEDDDGKAYQIYSSEDNGTIQISRLTDDYLKPAGRYIRILPGQFNEAPAMFKHDGKYFLITSGTSGWAPNAARLATADSIFGTWTPLGNPCRGTEQQMKTTFESQATFVLPVAGKKDAYIFMADRWRPKNAIDGRYIWLPVQWHGGVPYLQWQDNWNLGFFDKSN
ncbi:MAG TPA: glycoside hydrolase family 43 protein [Candidatus Aquilonibacter sp.]|nr:glycoside hydrolase family 43 protein [Candidatus Aquilonibacter sp.]